MAIRVLHTVKMRSYEQLVLFCRYAPQGIPWPSSRLRAPSRRSVPRGRDHYGQSSRLITLAEESPGAYPLPIPVGLRRFEQRRTASLAVAILENAVNLTSLSVLRTSQLLV